MSNEKDMTLGELGYEYGEKHGQFSVYPYGVRYFLIKIMVTVRLILDMKKFVQ